MLILSYRFKTFSSNSKIRKWRNSTIITRRSISSFKNTIFSFLDVLLIIWLSYSLFLSGLRFLVLTFKYFKYWSLFIYIKLLSDLVAQEIDMKWHHLRVEIKIEWGKETHKKKSLILLLSHLFYKEFPSFHISPWMTSLHATLLSYSVLLSFAFRDIVILLVSTFET